MKILKFIWQLFIDENGGTLSITRKSANTLITASGFNTNFDQIEAEVNSLDTTNYADDSITAAKLASDVVRSGYGLLQHTDGSLYVDVYGVLINAGTDGVAWGRAGDMLLSSNATTPDGFSDVSSTYANKFIRISATALSTAGADTHTHSVTVDSHTLTTAEIPAHTHTFPEWATASGSNPRIVAASDNLGSSSNTSSTGGGGGHNHTASTASGDNVPAYVTLKMYQKS